MHLAIKECKFASEYLAIHDCQIAIPHLMMKVRKIAIDFCSKREPQMTSNYLAMLVMFTHLAMKESQIASNFFSKREHQVTTAVMYVLPNKLFKTRIFCFCFITIWQSCIAKYFLAIWHSFIAKCVCLQSCIHRTSVQ